MSREIDDDCSELSRAEMRAGRVSWDYMAHENAADRSSRKTAAMRERAFVKAQSEVLDAWGIRDQAFVVDGNFWRGIKVAAGFTVVMSSLLALIGYRLFS